MSTGEKIIAGAALVGVGLLAGQFLDINPFSTETSESATADHNTIVRDAVGMEVSLGILSTSSVVKLNAEGSVGIGPLKTHWQDPYTGSFVGDISFVLKDGASEQVDTTRESLKSAPLPNDKVTVLIDRSKLAESRPRLVLNPENADNSFKVKDGYIVKRSGSPVIPKERVFARDGKYNTPASRIDGSESYESRVFHRFSGGNFSNGGDAETHIAWVGQVAAQSTACVDEAWKVAPPDNRANVAVKDWYAQQGYARKNITVGFVEDTQWPKPEELKDENGRTFTDNLKDVEDSLPGSEKVKFTTECNVGTSHKPSERELNK